MLRGASALPPAGFAAFTNAFDALSGGGPMVNAIEFDAPPPLPELNAITEALPTAAMSPAGILTARWLSSSSVVGRLCPFQRTTVRGTKLEPVTESVNSAPPDFAEAGATEP